MAVTPILSSAITQRTTDISSVKQHQDSKPMVDQQNGQVQVAKKTEEMRRQVVHQSDASKMENHADAREEGKNKYFFQRKNAKQEKEPVEDKVVKKEPIRGGFDMKV